MNTRFTLPFIVCAGLATSGCNTANSDWKDATMANTLTAYQTFLEKHADDKRADNARGRILALQDEQAWATAMKTNTLESFREYLKVESGGVYADDARYHITALERAAAWRSLQEDLSVGSLRAFLQKYPQGPESNEARAKLNDLSYPRHLTTYRVTSAPMSQATASSAGATLERAHQSCKLVEGLGA
jgi:hypothetical protein